jgi:hypothetical protein
MALSADREVKFYASQELIELGVDDNVLIYKGALVGLNAGTGYARPLSAGDAFVGLAFKQADNTITGHTAGGVSTKLHQNIDAVLPLAGVTITDIGAEVYASDDATLTLTATGNSRIGRIVAVEGTGLARVRLQPVAST